MAQKNRVLEVDSRHRLTLGSGAVEAGAQYRMDIDGLGVITLTPVATEYMDPEEHEAYARWRAERG